MFAPPPPTVDQLVVGDLVVVRPDSGLPDVGPFRALTVARVREPGLVDLTDGTRTWADVPLAALILPA